MEGRLHPLRAAAVGALLVLALGGTLDLHWLAADEDRHTLGEVQAGLAQAPCENARALHVEPAEPVPVRPCPACLSSLQARSLVADLDGAPVALAEAGLAPPTVPPGLQSLARPDTAGCRGPPARS